MAITKERLQEFMRVYEEEFNEPISEDEARDMTHRLLELYQILAAPLPSEVKQTGELKGRPPDQASPA